MSSLKYFLHNLRRRKHASKTKTLHPWPFRNLEQKHFQRHLFSGTNFANPFWEKFTANTFKKNNCRQIF